MRAPALFLTAVLAASLPACNQAASSDEPLTTAEASAALEELTISTQAGAFISSTVEISTTFTIGAAVEAAAEELRAYITSQLPCAAITLSQSSLHIEYGALPGSCVYRGRTYSGSHTITVSHNDQSEVVVDHEWSKLSDGFFSVTGTAKVSWTLADPARHVEHDLTWTRLLDGRSSTGSGDRVQRPLPGGIIEGFVEDGSRTWESQSGTWNLDIDTLEMRWVDPVPQAGTLTLVTPSEKSAAVSFERLDADTISVTLSSGGRSFTFKVNKLGGIS